MILIEQRASRLRAADQSSADILHRGNFGSRKNGSLELEPEEALYLMDVRNASCLSNGKKVTFNDIASKFWRSDRFAARYFTFKDWRDRGLIIKRPVAHKPYRNVATKIYPKSAAPMPRHKASGIFFKADLLTIVEDDAVGRELYERWWFGQYGSYKASERGRLNKLDIYETMFLMSRGILEVSNTSRTAIMNLAKMHRKDFERMYSVYADWREKGYVIKTGFKFGTHFRVYFPGARPVANGSGQWIHSRHVIHVFPAESRLLISEWARAIRVAHSVRKTFILAVPGSSRRQAKAHIDYILYHRHGGEADTPKESDPAYAMLSMGEEEYIGGRELAAAIATARNMGLALVLAIADRESSVTYYRVSKISPKGSKNDYYEIDWMQP